jgi:hypothetical protein
MRFKFRGTIARIFLEGQGLLDAELSLTIRYGAAYAFFMKRSLISSLHIVGITLLLGHLTLAEGYAATTEFYSWISPTGEIVLTDDAGKIPHPRQGGVVSIHRYEEVAQSSRNKTVSSKSYGVGIAKSTPPGFDAIPADVSEMMGADYLGLPPVLLEQPDPSYASEYEWMPLASPIYFGSYPLYGVWSRNIATGASSTAFQQRIQRLLLQMQARGHVLPEGRNVSSHRARPGQHVAAGHSLPRSSLPGYASTGTISPSFVPVSASSHTAGSPMPCCGQNSRSTHGPRGGSRH